MRHTNLNTKYRKGLKAMVKPWKLLTLSVLVGLLTIGCDDFLEVDLPKNQIISEAVFQDAATARAALSNIYVQIRQNNFVTGMSLSMGWYADELDNFLNENDFFDHTFTAINSPTSWWNNTYSVIYAANAVIEGVDNSTSLSLADQNQLKGEALFIRAYLHSVLVDIWAPVPYINTTDYIVNSTVSRMPVETVYTKIIEDLTLASDLLDEDVSTERVRAYKAVADALLARIYLYTQQWELSEETASKLIDNFVLEPDLSQVFLKNSSETIWQLAPPFDGENTRDGRIFILSNTPGRVALSDAVVEAFEPNDGRASNWVGLFDNTWYFPYKYKEANNTDTSLEYPIIFRLAEQYLIRAEARTEQGNLAGAQSDLNAIRTRAGLPNTTAATKADLLQAILDERQVELFSEHGHRWFDLKRWFELDRAGNAAEVLAPLKPEWRDTDILLPVPESEILLNPNLLPQNDGYN